MRRDIDLIRVMMLAVEKADEPVNVDAFADDAHPRELCAYNAALMAEAGLADCLIKRSMSGEIVYAEIHGLTWAGADWLDAVRSKSLWKQVKMKVAGAVGSASFDVLKQVACQLALKALSQAQFSSIHKPSGLFGRLSYCCLSVLALPFP